MTLIIGILCTDGVVMASDGAATLGSLGAQTAKQSVRKLQVQHNHIVTGVSGSVGLGQRIQYEIDKWYVSTTPKAKTGPEAMVAISAAIRTHILAELKAANVAKDVLGAALAAQSAITSTMVAMVVGDNPCLFQFDAQGAPEHASKDLPCVSIGSGQGLADPFLGFLRRVFHPKGMPSLNEGIFWAVWALQHAIEINPGGVAAPVQIVVLEKKDGGWLARELEDKECTEHLENIAQAEAHLRGYFTEKPAVAPPPTPAPVATN